MKKAIYIIILFLLCGGFLGVYYMNQNKEASEDISTEVSDFTTRIIKQSFKSENYLISPYSIETALNMLNVGAQGETKKELEKVVTPRKINISNKNIKIANALFIKSIYDNVIENSFKKELKEKYNSEILYDEFKTPNVINTWVDKSTDGMIKKVIDTISEDFVLGLANAIAIDANWSSQFECNYTTSEKFTRLPGKSMSVEMMHQTYNYDAKYFIGDDYKAVLLPYQENLEFIGILPNRSVENYINKFNVNSLNEDIERFEDTNPKKRLVLSIPRFSYEYSLDDFKNILISLGIKSAFNSEKADLTSIISRENLEKNGMNNIYISDAVHKTYIDLNEKGTKAAAVTYFGIKTSGAYVEDYDEVKIEFNKPFVYIIRDKNSKEVLFFGTVYEPNVWNGSTCSKFEE